MTDAEMRAYLLGQAPEADVALFEERLLEDEQIYTTLRSVEDDLFDEFAQGTLTETERAQFLERYSADRSRLLVARALAQRSGSPRRIVARAKPAIVGRWTWMPIAAAAALVVAVGATLTIPRRANVATPVRPTATVPTLAPAVLVVTLGTSRSAGTQPVVALERRTSALELHVRLDPSDRFERYSFELRDETGSLAWHEENLRASTQNGEPIVVGAVPAGALEAGSYELAVRGMGGASPSETLGFAAVKVNRIP